MQLGLSRLHGNRKSYGLLFKLYCGEMTWVWEWLGGVGGRAEV